MFYLSELGKKTQKILRKYLAEGKILVNGINQD